MYQGADNSRITSHAGGGDAGLPTHLTFDNSMYAGIQGYSDNIQLATFKENLGADPSRSNTQERVQNQFVNDASKYAFGDIHNDGEQEKGRAAMEALVQGAYQNKGPEGLRDLAQAFDKKAMEQYGGEKAFEQAPPGFENSAARFSVTPNKDGSTQVQFNFAQPNSPDVKPVIVQVPKPELEKPFAHPITGNYEI
jgi:hypothetical protein